MKKRSVRFFVLVLLSVFFVSCNGLNNKKEQQTDHNIELEEEEITTPQETVKLQGKRLHPKFKVTEYCKAEDQDSVMFYLGKFGNKTAFNISVEKVNNQLKVIYRVIDDCCLKFRGKASMDSTKLNLFHLKRAGNPCECKCMYEFEFSFRDLDMPDKLFVNKEEVQF